MPESGLRGRFVRIFALVLLPLLVGACAGTGSWAPDEVVQRALHVNNSPAEITLLTVINKRTGAGDHSSLIIDGDHRVLYDPSGTWHNRHAPRRNDVHYGFTPQLEEYYLDYHARPTHHVVMQTLSLTREQAAQAMSAAESLGPAAPGLCAVRTGAILRSISGVGGLRSTYFPRNLMDSFGEVPGVTTRQIEDTDVSGQIVVSASELQ